MSSVIQVENLRKAFALREPARDWRERVAFVGPNGAGKSTALKILSGILHPTSGHVLVAGKVPWRERQSLAYEIGTVFGQRSQLWYHLPARDTFELLRHIYDRDVATHRRRLATLVEAFSLAEILDRPVRQLSLGQRMRLEIAASLLHAPRILFLDEPTIGLDVSAKAVVRELVREASTRDGCSVLLTSHDTGDMEQVCERVLMIHRGRLLLDEPVEKLRRAYLHRKIVTLHTEQASRASRLPGVTELTRDEHTLRVEVDVTVTPVEAVLREALEASRVRDVSVEDPPLETVVQAIYTDAERSPTRARIAS